MLKRRAISPPPGSTVPLVSDPHPRESKRRRILPPSLDGQSRRSMVHADEDDGEVDDDEDVHFSNGRNQFGPDPSTSAAHNTEYESANTFLHDLHALHRHRLIFSSSFPQPEFAATPHTQDKSYLAPIPDFGRTSDKQDPSGVLGFGCGPSIEEVQSVKERYEDTNKLLGSLFLTRRKQLDPQPHNST
ncbi:hypothetical protein C8R46DRAFT_1089514 [Mycena filopes]|nr:hypothetical protein C8R46DRAFT_1089514 [Mycena filopes]